MFIKIIVKLNDLLHKFVQKASRKTLNRCNLDIDRKFFAEVCLWNVSLFLLLWNTHQPHHQASKWKYICFELGACSMDLIYSFFLYIHINFVSVNPLAPMKKKDVAFHIDFSPFFSGIWFIQPDNQNAELSSWMDFNVWGFIYTLGSSHQIAERERKRKRECEHKKKNQQRRAQFQNLFLSVVTLHNADFFFAPVLYFDANVQCISPHWHCGDSFSEHFAVYVCHTIGHIAMFLPDDSTHS